MDWFEQGDVEDIVDLRTCRQLQLVCYWTDDFDDLKGTEMFGLEIRLTMMQVVCR